MANYKSLNSLNYIFNIGDNEIRVSKGFGNSNKQAQTISFTEIASTCNNFINNNQSGNDKKAVKRCLARLRKVSMFEGFQFQEDFVNSGFDNILIYFISNYKFMKISLEIVTNISSYNNNFKYAKVLYDLGILNILGDKIAQLKKPDHMYNILQILINFTTICKEYRDDIISHFPIAMIIKFGFDNPQYVKQIVKLLYAFFCFGIPNFDFSELFPLIKDLYIKNRNEVTFLWLFAHLARFSNFLDYFYSKNPKENIANELIEKALANNDKISIPSLTFCYIIIKTDFSLVEPYIPGIINKIGSSTVEVAAAASLIIKHVMKYESELISKENRFIYIASHLVGNLEKSSLSLKVIFFKTLCRLTKICDNNTLFEILRHNFILILIDFLSSEDYSLIKEIIDELTFLIDKESKENESQNVLEQFVANNGVELLNDLSTNEDCEHIVNQFLEKYISKLSES